ncbi:MAG: hypothetical protein HF978_06790 [Desulfobacteraceae bacterium]|nr:hypothetical protein [Desulfobacteraceae bacterium]MBC2755239.1 hypothetical protein [Desulfobacteraceae bacterium]
MKGNIFRWVCVGLIVSVLLVVSGCGYGEYMKRSSNPTVNATHTVTRYDSKDYDVLGLVRAEGESRCVLGIIVEGTEGEALLWDAAISQFGDRVTGIKDINISYDYQSILPPIFSEIKSTYVGTAVHEK